MSKKRVGARGEYEHEQDRGNGTIVLQKKQFEKNNFAKGAKILRLSRKNSETNSAKL